MSSLDDVIPPQYLFGPRYRTSQIKGDEGPLNSESHLDKESVSMNQQRIKKYRDNPYYDQLNSQHYEQIENDKILFLSGKQAPKNPRLENYCKMLKITCCPVWKLLSLTTACLLIYIGVFIAEAIHGLNQEGTLLQINASTLSLFGANSPSRVKEGEVWRLVVAAVLHIDFNHLLGNSVTLIVLLSHIQYTIGVFRAFLLVLVSAIGGNILSALCDPNALKAGASTSLFGAVGFTLGYFILNWRGLDRIGPIMKCQLGCITFMILVFTIAFTSVGSNIDYFGHLGGFLTGLWLTTITKPVRYGKRQATIRGIFGFLLILQLAIPFILFFTTPLNLQ